MEKNNIYEKIKNREIIDGIEVTSKFWNKEIKFSASITGKYIFVNNKLQTIKRSYKKNYIKNDIIPFKGVEKIMQYIYFDDFKISDVVLHKNGNKYDDNLHNLRIISRSKLILQSRNYAILGIIKSAIVYNLKTNKCRNYESLRSCANDLNISYQFLCSHLKTGSFIYNNLKIIKIDLNEPIEDKQIEFLKVPGKNFQIANGKPVIKNKNNKKARIQKNGQAFYYQNKPLAYWLILAKYNIRLKGGKFIFKNNNRSDLDINNLIYM